MTRNLKRSNNPTYGDLGLELRKRRSLVLQPELALYIDSARWRAHLTGVIRRNPGIIPVAKGNGYGFTNEFLANVASELGVDSLAVGTIDEAREVLNHFAGPLLVLRPHSSGDDLEDLPDRVVFHAGSLNALEDLKGRRVILQCSSSIYDGGLHRDELREVLTRVDGIDVEGYAVSLPLERHGGERQATEIAELIEWLKVEKPAESLTIFVNHVDESEIDSLRDRYPEVKIRSRVGTKLWLGDAKALTITGTVIAVESVPRGKRFGYRQRKFRADAKIITVVGGTAHGVGLQAPKMARGGERLKTLYRAGMAAFNRNLSPFSWNDQKLLFAEPPHMSVSLLVLPKGVRPPAVGEELSASLRFTTTRFDRVSRSPSTD